MCVSFRSKVEIEKKKEIYFRANLCTPFCFKWLPTPYQYISHLLAVCDVCAVISKGFLDRWGLFLNIYERL